MHFRNVEIFCDVVAQRSFSRAAETSGVTQSAVSQAVHQLEKHLGATLLDRSMRPFELTEAGQIYYDGCKGILDDFRRIEDAVQKIGDKITGRVRVAAIFSVGLLEMKTWTQQFEAAYPDVELKLEYLHPKEVCDWVLEDKADLGLVSFPKSGSDFSVIPWQGQKMGIVVPDGHPFASRKKISVADLKGEKLVSFSSDLKIRRAIDKWLKAASVSVETVHEFDNIEYVKRAVEIGSGISILPEATVQKEIESGTLHLISIDDAEWVRPLGIIHKKGRTLTSAMAKFVELIQLGGAVEDSSSDSQEIENSDSSPALARTQNKRSDFSLKAK